MLTYVSAFISGGLEPFWPHVVLLSVSVVASIAVGVGIIFERPEYSLAIHRFAFWLIVAGIAFEAICTIFLFAFDEGISGAQQSKIEAQQSTIISLEKRIAPRNLTSEQEDKIADAIKQFAPMHFDLSMAEQGESMRLADEIEDSLLKAGWEEQLPDTQGTRFERLGRPPIGIRSVVGVWIIYPAKSDKKFEEAAEALSKALQEEDVAGPLYGNINANPYNLNKIHVWVGEKP